MNGLIFTEDGEIKIKVNDRQPAIGVPNMTTLVLHDLGGANVSLRRCEESVRIEVRTPESPEPLRFEGAHSTEAFDTLEDLVGRSRAALNGRW
ncbi:MAG: hypothetical protein DCC75_03290 [Proteobacteria bacterium]|nr:MAG: hypothetical protein DCC75_03290 [Pseudomonadota bacterium]